MQPTTTESRPALQLTASLTNSQLAVVTLGKLSLNTAYRIIYPLLPFLALHLSVDQRTVSALVTALVLATVVSPLGGALADTRGERTIMTGGLALFCAGVILCALWTTFAGFLAGYVLIGLSGALYQPAAQAYLSARTPYERRGWALGIFEVSWAAAALLGVAPLMQLVQATGDSAPVFWILLVTGAASLALIRFGLPAAQHSGRHARQGIDRRAVRTRGVAGMFALLLLTACAVDLILVVQGVWVKSSFGADEGQLGQIFGMLGIAELIGSIGSTLLVDRVGKKRAVVAGLTLTALSMAALPLSEGRWLLFLPLFFLFDLCFEFSIVSAFPLASGAAPTARGTGRRRSVVTS